jgi:hypothetical protein
MRKKAQNSYEAPKNVTDLFHALGRIGAEMGNKTLDRKDGKEMNNSWGKQLKAAMIHVEVARTNKTKATSPILK